MADNTRTTRLVALLAGNGYVLAQSISAYLQGVVPYSSMTFHWASDLLYSTSCSVIGLGSAYFALTRIANDRAGKRAEAISILALALPLLSLIVALMRGTLMHLPK